MAPVKHFQLQIEIPKIPKKGPRRNLTTLIIMLSSPAKSTNCVVGVGDGAGLGRDVGCGVVAIGGGKGVGGGEDVGGGGGVGSVAGASVGPGVAGSGTVGIN